MFAPGSLSQVVDYKSEGKGQPTPSRKEAQAARRIQMKQGVSRKEQARKQRAARDQIRERQRRAMKGEGSSRDLPPRDRGPVRALCRDFVDRRLTFAEWLLPVLILIFAMSMVPNRAIISAVMWVWSAAILFTVLDEVLLVRALRKELRLRGYSKSDMRGATAYTVMRSSQLRRLRLPKPVVKRGNALKAHY